MGSGGPPSPNSPIFVSENGAAFCDKPNGWGARTNDWRCEGRSGALPLKQRRPPYVWADPVPGPESPLWQPWNGKSP